MFASTTFDEVHVVMSVDALRRAPHLHAGELVDLTLHKVLEGARQAGMENGGRQPMPTQVRRHARLVLVKRRAYAWAAERRAQVQVQPHIDVLIGRDLRGTLGIGHEHHRAHGRHAAAGHAVERGVGGPEILAPVIRIGNQGTSMLCQAHAGGGSFVLDVTVLTLDAAGATGPSHALNG